MRLIFGRDGVPEASKDLNADVVTRVTLLELPGYQGSRLSRYRLR
jgi:hypothetical protein